MKVAWEFPDWYLEVRAEYGWSCHGGAKEHPIFIVVFDLYDLLMLPGQSDVCYGSGSGSSTAWSALWTICTWRRMMPWLIK